MKSNLNFTLENLYFNGVFLIKFKKFSDKRGFFFESFKKDYFFKKLKFDVVQENISLSKKDVIRGMHFQKPPYAQSKLISVLNGKIFDVFIDLRKDSKTYQKWGGFQLDSENNEQLFIPKGFAHGFLALSNNVKVSYKVDNYYNPSKERVIKWNDTTINIKWPISKPKLSCKDANAKTFRENEKEF